MPFSVKMTGTTIRRPSRSTATVAVSGVYATCDASRTTIGDTGAATRPPTIRPGAALETIAPFITIVTMAAEITGFVVRLA